MILPLPKTRGQLIALGVVAVVVLAFLYLFTPVFKGHAVEVSVENAGPNEIFVHIDTTGRHGENTPTISLDTTEKSKTPPGLRISPGSTKSLGMAVGIFDSPTLHVWALSDTGLADASRVNDCTFDTVSYRRVEIPSIHVRLKWTGSGCVRLQSASE